MATLVTEPGTSIKRVALASYVGSAIEYYDFYIYGTAAALVFPKVFFPHLGATMATVASMATFAAAFLSRPIGAAFFGHFGDRLGRKSTLIATLLIMGLSTVTVGLVPGATTIGIAAPLILLVLRLVQGFAVGGEWAGAALLSAEYAPAQARGRYGSTYMNDVAKVIQLHDLNIETRQRNTPRRWPEPVTLSLIHISEPTRPY